MNSLKKYIRTSLSITFLTMFIPLFSIASIVFLIKLAAYTSVIQFSLWEMIKLFFFIVPELFFYTLPISFFIAATLTMFKFSNDNEVIVMFALGIKPKLILRTLFKPALFLSIILLFDFFVLFPHAKTLYDNFISYKKSEAKFNLSASEFGHKFGDWLLYIGKENKDGTYADVVLFNKKQETEEVLIEADKAEIINDLGILRLKLSNGEGYSYSKDEFTQINFEAMFINDTMETSLHNYSSTIEYWLSTYKAKKKKRMFITDTLMSLFPVVSIFLVLSIGIVHARHQKSQIYLYLFLGIAIYYGMVLGLQKILSFYTIPVVLFVWLLVTFTIYRRAIVSKF